MVAIWMGTLDQRRSVCCSLPAASAVLYPRLSQCRKVSGARLSNKRRGIRCRVDARNGAHQFCTVGGGKCLTSTTVPANNSLSHGDTKEHPGQRWPWLKSCVQVPEAVFDRPPRHGHLLSGKS